MCCMVLWSNRQLMFCERMFSCPVYASHFSCYLSFLLLTNLVSLQFITLDIHVGTIDCFLYTKCFMSLHWAVSFRPVACMCEWLIIICIISNLLCSCFSRPCQMKKQHTCSTLKFYLSGVFVQCTWPML